MKTCQLWYNSPEHVRGDTNQFCGMNHMSLRWTSSGSLEADYQLTWITLETDMILRLEVTTISPWRQVKREDGTLAVCSIYRFHLKLISISLNYLSLKCRMD